MPTVQRLVNRGLRRFGLQLQRVAPRAPSAAPIDPAELRQVRQLIHDAIADNPGDHAWETARRYFNPIRMAFYLELVDLCAQAHRDLSQARVLEVGAYYGYVLRRLAQRWPGVQLYGSEMHPAVVPIAKALCPRADVRQGDLVDLPFDGPFDLLIMSEVLEHLVDPDAALERLVGLTAPGGAVVVTVPNGREDHKAANQFSPEHHSYSGHINFWSPESWGYFLQRQVGERGAVDHGQMASGHLYAILRLHP